MEASDLLGLQMPPDEAHVWVRAGTPGASSSRFSEVGGPGGSSSRKKNDSREGPQNHTRCGADGTSRGPKTAVPSRLHGLCGHPSVSPWE